MKRLGLLLAFTVAFAAPAMAQNCGGVYAPGQLCGSINGGFPQAVNPVPGILGTLALQSASNVAITGGAITGLPSPSNASDAATKQYVDNTSAGLIVHTQASFATAAALAANTYSNGSSGVGATLTGNAVGALAVDGIFVSSSQRIVVKNEVAQANNGIYSVTATGSPSTQYVLTRTTDANTPGTGNVNEIGYGTYVFVTNGNVNGSSGWSVNSTVTTIGTSVINWVQFSASANTTVSNGDGTLTISPNAGNIVASIALGHPNTWTGAQTFVGPLTINPTAATANQGFVINQTGPTSGTTTGAVTNCTAGNSGLAYNTICVNGESAAVSAGGVPYTTALNLALITGGTNSTGQKSVIKSLLIVNTAESAQARDHIVGVFSSVAQVNMGGTNTGAGASGTLFALNPTSTLQSGATNLFTLSGAEVDVGIQTGASAKYRLGWSVVDNGNLQAASFDAAYEVAAAGGPGWKTAFLLDNIHGSAPLSTTGCVICTDGSAVTITTGIDLSAYTISGNFLKGPSGFQVTGGAAITALSLNGESGQNLVLNAPSLQLVTLGVNGTGVAAVGAANLYPLTDLTTALGAASFRWSAVYANAYFVGGSNTAGVNCSGAPSGSFTASAGIVTHC